MELFPIWILSRAGHQTFAYTTTAYRVRLRNSPRRVSAAISAAISAVASLAASAAGTGALAATISYAADIGAAVIKARAAA